VTERPAIYLLGVFYFRRGRTGQHGSGEVIMVLLWGTKRKCEGHFFLLTMSLSA